MGLTHREIEDLLGAHALDAVDPDERAVVERHLAGCPRCRAEVVEYREVAALLAHGGGPAPAGVWDRIADGLDEGVAPVAPPVLGRGPDDAPVVVLADRARRRGRLGPGRIGLAAAGVAAAAVIGVLGWRVVEQDRRLDELATSMGDDAMARAASVAMADPDSRHAELAAPTGEMEAVAVVTVEGDAYLLGDRLPSLPADRTYQLWGVLDSGEVVSLGLLGNRPGVEAFHAPANVGTLAVTDEPAGGVVVSGAPPMVVGELA
ncbi:MAG: anti-sigma factor [Acidimicrobiales bacterium]|nr:anti-sigma factor [Acidimicrobiales bacterium]